MKMKLKDIFTIILCSALIIFSVYYILNSLKPKQKELTPAEKISQEIPKSLDDQFDEKTLEKVKSLTDYGKPALENIGKSNPFSPVE